MSGQRSREGLLSLFRLFPVTARGREVMGAIEFDSDELARELLGDRILCIPLC